MENNQVIKPQDGFQVQFLSSPADITIGGAAAGVGKTFAELLAPLRHKDTKGFNAIFFRRTTVQIRNPGGLWDESTNLYPLFNASSNSQHLSWFFPSGVLVKFAHLEHEKNIYDHQGAQYCLIIFDELTHFTKKQFWYLLSRNRSTCGVKPYCMASCNPDPDSFVAELIEWWIDQNEKLPDGEKNPNYGYPINERIGVVRFLIVDQDTYVWGNTKQEVIAKCPHIFGNPAFAGIDPESLVKSITFIPGNIYDNKELMRKNPEYLSNLMAQDEDEKLRLLYGNWKIRIDPDCIFMYACVENMFTNFYPANTNDRYITCDAARFGNDFTTIFVWYGWRVVKLVILTKSDAQEIVNAIEAERARHFIVKGKVMVDQDGVGGHTVKLGGYKGFHALDPPMEDPSIHKKESYKNFKTQCYYRYAEKVNSDEVSMQLSDQNVQVDGVFSVKMKVNGQVMDVRVLIKQDHRAIKRAKKDNDGKLQINTKDEQKVILRGRSPDFSDGAMMRAAFDIRSGKIVSGNPTPPSLLDNIK